MPGAKRAKKARSDGGGWLDAEGRQRFGDAQDYAAAEIHGRGFGFVPDYVHDFDLAKVLGVSVLELENAPMFRVEQAAVILQARRTVRNELAKKTKARAVLPLTCD